MPKKKEKPDFDGPRHISEKMTPHLRTVAKTLKGIETTGMGHWTDQNDKDRSVFCTRGGRDVDIRFGQYTLELYNYRRADQKKFKQTDKIYLKSFVKKDGLFRVVLINQDGKESHRTAQAAVFFEEGT